MVDPCKHRDLLWRSHLFVPALLVVVLAVAANRLSLIALRFPVPASITSLHIISGSNARSGFNLLVVLVYFSLALAAAASSIPGPVHTALH